eukprot:jgi/Botrbrau1/22731/Bobra.0132s0069.1
MLAVRQPGTSDCRWPIFLNSLSIYFLDYSACIFAIPYCNSGGIPAGFVVDIMQGVCFWQESLSFAPQDLVWHSRLGLYVSDTRSVPSGDLPFCPGPCFDTP